MNEEHQLLAIFIILAIVVTICAQAFLSHQLKEFKAMVAESITHLREQIEHAKTVKEKAVALLEHMRERLDELANHPTAAEIRALADELRTNTDRLATAIGEGEEEED